MTDEIVRLDGATLSARSLHAVAHGARVELDAAAWARMRSGADRYAALEDVDPLADKWAWLVGGPRPATTQAAVRRLLLGHCAAVGDPLPGARVRATMAARVNVLATGLSGCRPEVAELYLAMLNRGVVPVVPRQGSVGAAGDLAPLAHIARVALRLGGEADRDGRRLPAAEAMRGLPELRPSGKEALSLINGATLSSAMAAVAVVRARRLLDTAVAAVALSYEALGASRSSLHPEALGARQHLGAVAVARQLREMLEGSERSPRRQGSDAFSLRCAPAVLGAAVDALAYVEQVVHAELNGACDNPLLCGDELVEAGNVHGAPIALAMDHLKVVMTQVASIAERRIFRLSTGHLSGLPSFLVPDGGMQSGLMLAQYTAASLVSECKGLAHPASVDSLPTAQHHEDHVSMAPIAARAALYLLDAVADVLAIELLCAAQALDLAEGGSLSEPCASLHARIRRRVSTRTRDRVLSPDLARLGRAVRAGELCGPAQEAGEPAEPPW